MRLLTTLSLATVLALTACEGPEGPQGATGPAGPQGEAGEDGTNGTDGNDGATGQDGQDGVDGTDGVDGEDGRALMMRFQAAPFPKTDAQKRQILASEKAWVDGEEHAIGYTTLARTGDTFGDVTFGAKYDKDLNELLAEDGSVRTTSSMDFNSFLEVDGNLFMVTQFETYPGAIYVSELAQDATTGELSITATNPVDLGEDGLWNPCAGSVSPWGTHLGSEEYPEDPFRVHYEQEYEPSYIFGQEQMFEYFGYDAEDDWATIQNDYDALAYGFITEVTVAGDGTATFAKHYAMGRAAFELAYVMPDSKTVYMTSDDTNQPLLMFVADTAEDLSSGTLYAAKFFQTSQDGAPNGHGDLEWIELGSATNAEIKAIIDGDEGFFDWWDSAEPTGESSCPSGYTGINIAVTEFSSGSFNGSPQCVKIKAGKEKAAAFLDTRRYAAYLGATTEFRKEEGFTFDPVNSRAFVVYSEIERGMEDANGSYDDFGPNDVRVAYNECGGVFGLDIGPDPAIGSDYVAYNLYSYVEGIDMRQTGTDYEGTVYENNRCSINGIANPDNVTVIPGYDVLIIGEDTGSGHQNDAIWAYDMRMHTLTRIQTTPYGSETTSPYWYPEINGYGYMTSTVQHPYGESDEDEARNESDRNGYVGYVGPFPAMPWN